MPIKTKNVKLIHVILFIPSFKSTLTLPLCAMLYFRWKKYEIHDIVIECAKVSLDPKEASCEEGYATMPEHFNPQLHLRPQDCASSPYTDLHSSYGQKTLKRDTFLQHNKVYRTK